MSVDMCADPNVLIDCTHGRLVLTRALHVQNVEQAVKVKLDIASAFERVGGQAIVCSDWRRINVFSQPVADCLLDMFRRTNALVKRGAILIAGEGATFGWQLERLLREAKNPERRSFRDAPRLLAWLAEVLSASELRMASEFLSK